MLRLYHYAVAAWSSERFSTARNDSVWLLATGHHKSSCDHSGSRRIDNASKIAVLLVGGLVAAISPSRDADILDPYDRGATCLQTRWIDIVWCLSLKPQASDVDMHIFGDMCCQLTPPDVVIVNDQRPSIWHWTVLPEQCCKQSCNSLRSAQTPMLHVAR